MEECGCELILAGHLHLAYTGDVRAHHLMTKRSVLVAQAGTVFSHRRRGEPNAYNFITVNYPSIRFDVRSWDGNQYSHTLTTDYDYNAEGGWVKKV